MKTTEIKIETPCGMSWDAMKAEGPKAVKRFCGDCKKHVHDLSKMSKNDAKDLLASESTEGLCVRYLYDDKGNVVFKGDERLVASNALTRMARARRFMTAAAALALPMSLNACMGAAPRREPAIAPQQTSQQMQNETNPLQQQQDGGAPATPTTPSTTNAAADASAPLAK